MELKNKIIDYCLSKPFTTEHFPFDESTWVCKVHNKMFALMDILSDDIRINLKYPSDLVDELRSQYSCVLPGYHMNKQHWNTVVYDSQQINFRILTEWIDKSYLLVYNSLPKKIKIQNP